MMPKKVINSKDNSGTLKCPTSRNLKFFFANKSTPGLYFNGSDCGAGWLNKFFNSQSQRDNIPRIY
jgi:hypothetical protein